MFEVEVSNRSGRITISKFTFQLSFKFQDISDFNDNKIKVYINNIDKPVIGIFNILIPAGLVLFEIRFS